jgi:hypothetical protein
MDTFVLSRIYGRDVLASSHHPYSGSSPLLSLKAPAATCQPNHGPQPMPHELLHQPEGILQKNFRQLHGREGGEPKFDETFRAFSTDFNETC